MHSTSTSINTCTKATVPWCAALALLATGAQAESTYGYNAGGTGTVSANARLSIEVRVPLLILLRVGASGTPPGTPEITLSVSPDAAGIPGGQAALTDGNATATGWNGVAPTFTAPAPVSIPVYVWTNAPAGGSLSRDTPIITTNGPANTALLVDSTGSALAHPGANLGGIAPSVSFTGNTLHSGNWAYGLDPGAISTLQAGTFNTTVTYTATTP